MLYIFYTDAFVDMYEFITKTLFLNNSLTLNVDGACQLLSGKDVAYLCFKSSIHQSDNFIYFHSF